MYIYIYTYIYIRALTLTCLVQSHLQTLIIYKLGFNGIT